MSADQAKRIMRGIHNFQSDMITQGIHLGMPDGASVVRCVTCGELWPCAGSRPVGQPETEQR